MRTHRSVGCRGRGKAHGWVALVVFAAFAGCGGSGGDAPSGSTPGGGPAGSEPSAVAAPVVVSAESVASEVLAGLGAGEPFEVTAARPWDARACVSGVRGGLEVLVCSYADEAGAEGAKKKLNGFLAGAQSGVVVRAGESLMALADKAKVDPKGYEIARLVEAFSASKQAPAP